MESTDIIPNTDSQWPERCQNFNFIRTGSVWKVVMHLTCCQMTLAARTNKRRMDSWTQKGVCLCRLSGFMQFYDVLWCFMRPLHFTLYPQPSSTRPHGWKIPGATFVPTILRRVVDGISISWADLGVSMGIRKQDLGRKQQSQSVTTGDAYYIFLSPPSHTNMVNFHSFPRTFSAKRCHLTKFIRVSLDWS